MNNITKNFIMAANEHIVEKAKVIERIISSSLDNDTIVKSITDEIEDIKELLEIRTKLLK